MSFATINQCAQDADLQGRVTACAAGELGGSPVDVTANLIWVVSAAGDIAAAYASALAAGIDRPGADESVITDQMILSAVQAHLPT